jgi:hypothetical protein
VRETRFFFPHDTETAPWWQGEDARLGSLAFAARAGRPLFADDPALRRAPARLRQDQLDWILGRNPFDASLLEGAGHDNPEYRFLGSFEYTNAPGGIVNGITAGFDDPRASTSTSRTRDRRRQRLALGRAVAAPRHVVPARRGRGRGAGPRRAAA